MNFCESRYIDMCDIESAFRSSQNELHPSQLQVAYQRTLFIVSRTKFPFYQKTYHEA